MRDFCALLAAFGVLVAVSPAAAQNPYWPPDMSVTRAELANPMYWPSDPGYGYDVAGDSGDTCNPDGVCWDRATGGSWNMWSWVPPEVIDSGTLRSDEASMGAGVWADMAWRVTIGDRRVVIAVLDSGIRWQEPDLVDQYFINTAELDAPMLPADCKPGAQVTDQNGDGFVSMSDWFAGLSPDDAAARRSAIDDAGNRNGVAEPGDLIVMCSDGVDQDGNGYTDDISGWDFHHDDNDPADDTDFGHGSGEARWSTAAGNDGQGRLGFCPGCRVLMVRVGDSFVVDVQDYAQGAVFAVDSGARVVQEALGSMNNTTFMRRANDYAYESGVLVVASAADENSRHHNYPGTSNHTLYVHAVRQAGPTPQNARSYLAYNNCTNYGAQLVLSAPGEGCSSEATGVTAGVAGLVLSASIDETRPGGPLDPPLRTEELRQLLLMNADDIDVPESQPDHPAHQGAWYPSLPGWDQRFGYGRLNAWRAVEALGAGRIPPEVDVVYPDWFHVFDPDRTGVVEIRGRLAADRAQSYDYVIEWAPGVEPTDDAFQTLAMGSGVTEPMEGVLHTWDISDAVVDNPGEEENRYTVTVRIRVTADYGGTVGTVLAEQRRAFAIHRDTTLLPGFPVALGVRNTAADAYPAASGEAAPKMADIDGDGDVEILYGDADGLVHVFQHDGSELAGYPVQLGRLRGLDPADPDHILGSAGYASGAVDADDVASSLDATLAVGDLDNDGSLEIVAVTMEGGIYALHAADATPVDGFPVSLPEVPSGDTLRGGPPSRDRVVEQGAFAAPALADLDDDGALEIIVAAFDGQVHVYRADGGMQAGFPVEVVAPALWMERTPQPSRIMTTPAVGDVNGDGLLDIAVGSNEKGERGNSGAYHVIHGDGSLHEGGPQLPGWPVNVPSIEVLPVVGEGTPSSVAMADVDLDGVADLTVTGTASPMMVVRGDLPPQEPGQLPESIVVMNGGLVGPLGSPLLPANDPLFNTFANPAFGDLDGDGRPDFTTGGAGVKLAINLAGGWENDPFEHQVGVWNTQTGEPLPGYRRTIEDYMFFVNPSVADVSGDGYPEVILGSGGYYVHAWDACGREAEGWPKFTGGWITSSAALGDVDGDGLLEAAITTRSGYLYVYDTDGPADGAISWPEFHHDNHNTGNYEMPLPNGGQRVAAAEPIECPVPPPPDAGMGDGGAGDAGAGDAGTVSPGGGGCGCRTASPRRASALSLVLFLAPIGFLGRRRRRRSSQVR